MIRNSVARNTLLSPSPPFLRPIIVSHFSVSSSPTPPPHTPRRHHHHHDEESRNVRVSVWWDFENCHPPAGTSVFKVAQAITAAVRTGGIRGPVQITAFGDMMQLSRANQEALSSTGITLNHIPNGGKNSADRSLLVDLMYWVSQNPPPAHLFLISGDRDFAGVLHRLRMNNYNILLASKDNAPSILCSAASIMWNWNALIKGENLTGRYFNQPPDGPYGSWYGYYKVPLEDPFAIVEQPTCLPQEELSDVGSDSKIRPIPKAVMRQVRHILRLHPKGMQIGELRSELGKSNVVIDKDLYGYKKFTRFLSAMTHILKLRPTGDGQFVIHGIAAKAPEPFEPNPNISTGPVVNNGNPNIAESSNPIGEDASICQSTDVNSFLAPSHEEELSRKVQQSPPLAERTIELDKKPPEMEQSSLIGEKVVEVANEQLTDGSSVKEQDSVAEVGIYKKFWKILFGSSQDVSETKSCDIPKEPYVCVDMSQKKGMDTLGECVTSNDSIEKKVDGKDVKSSSQDCDPVQPSSCSTSSTEPTLEGKSTAISSQPYGEKSEERQGFFDRIISWCKFCRISPNSHTSGDQPSEVLEHGNKDPRKHQIFSEDSFWKDIESFINTQSGLLVMSQSRTRQEMAQNLQKKGPSVLRSFNESNVLQVVDILISEKKWVEECSSETSPFKIIRPISHNASLPDSHSSNGLRSIFLSRQSQSDLQKLEEHNEDKKFQNISHSGVSLPVTNRKYLGRSRKEVLGDCQKLVNEVLKEYPEGFNMGAFRFLFLKKYGYHLDIQKLGYQKLASLLQIMPGLKIESTYIIPSSKAPKCLGQGTAVSNTQEGIIGNASGESDGELSDSSKKDDESDSPWEELGPVADIGSTRKELKSSSRKAVEETHMRTYPEYDSLSDDDFSDSDGESLMENEQEGQAKKASNAEDSALIRILDSWYGSKEDNNNGKDNREKNSRDVDHSPRDYQTSNSSGLGTKIENYQNKYGSKRRPQKYVSFVAAPDSKDKDKLPDVGQRRDQLVDGILCSLKK